MLYNVCTIISRSHSESFLVSFVTIFSERTRSIDPAVNATFRIKNSPLTQNDTGAGGEGESC